MNLAGKSRKDIGAYGERAAAEYLRRKGFRIEGKNVVRKTGELDLIARHGKTLHFVEVKSMLCREFPEAGSSRDQYNPSMNLHAYKVRNVARTAEWYVAEKDWEGEWQVDAVLVWLRERDGVAKVAYLPQIL
jgi:putative endonuclease